MATYTTLGATEALFAKFKLGANTTPNTTEGEAMLDAVEAEVNAALASQNVSVPVASPATFVSYLGTVVQYGAAAAILKARLPDAAGPGESPAYAFWEARYRAALDRIENGEGLPPNLTTADDGINPSTYFTRNPNEEETLGDLAGASTFTVAKKF